MFVGEAIYKGFLCEISKNPLVTRVENRRDLADPSCSLAIAHTIDGFSHLVGKKQASSYRCFPLEQCKLSPGSRELESVYAGTIAD